MDRLFGNISEYIQYFTIVRSFRKEIRGCCKLNNVNIPFPHKVIKND